MDDRWIGWVVIVHAFGEVAWHLATALRMLDWYDEVVVKDRWFHTDVR